MAENRDGYPTSWPAQREARWDAFRELVKTGVDIDDAADAAGIASDPAH